jgi:tetratricopeptide (TPR) repeat protein
MQWIAAAIFVGLAAAVASHLISGYADRGDEPLTIGPQVGMPGSPPTSADGLRQRVTEMERRLQAHPQDAGAAVLLADALLRQARATTDGRHANRASQVLTEVLKATPSQYDALRMLGAIYLSQHRFRDALDLGRRARDLRPNDAWNYGVMGDALIELGEYDQGFQAFDTMASMRPSAAAYARVAYGRELSGDVEGALSAMHLAEQATAVQDVESQAWYAAQVGELYLRMVKLDDAEREFRRAMFVYPNYPHATIGFGKVKVARGDHDGALATYLDQLTRTPTLDLSARIGDLYAARGDRANAERYYQLAEDLAGPAVVQTEPALALFLSEHDRKLEDALTIAKAVASMRHDIFTEDALAWAYYKAGRLDEAAAASTRALRTGTRDDRILSHAARIRAATRHRS